MSLYHKHRPTDFDQILGNAEMIKSLQSAVEKEDPPHAYLFTGPSGCGKTTLARIAASKLGCVGDDFREVDSADFRGIDTIRDIRRQSVFQGLHGGRRAWLLDECHKLSNDGQSALLKALEDPPNHVYYFLATTDPQKLLETIKGRCAKFQVSLLTETQMKRLIRQVTQAAAPSLMLEKEVVEQIILDAQGHARNALQTLERVLDADPDDRLAIAKKSAEQQSKVIELCRALIEKSTWIKVRQILQGLKDENAEGVRQAVLGYCSAVLLNKENDQAGAIMEAFAQNTYDSGFSAIVYACYSIVRGGGD
jgi:DNA polymerase III gamma/tau subunit